MRHYAPTDDLVAFIQSLPKTETHLHLEGALPFGLLQEAFPTKYPEEPPMWDPAYRYASFDAFMDLYVQFCAEFFASPERYHAAAKQILADCLAQNCRYVEISFHLASLLPMGGADAGPDVIAAIREAAPPGLELRLFGGLCHDHFDESMRSIAEAAASQWEGLDGLDLHGPENLPMESWTARLWQTAREHGRFTKAHAGEFMPARYVAWVLDHLKVNRIEHGVRSVEDPALVKRLVDEGITLDICPISNVKLAVEGIPSMAAHPIRQLFDSGVSVTVNSDDPFMFGNTLTEDYVALAIDLDFTRQELIQLARNGFEIALWDDEAKAPYLAELSAIAATL